MEREAASVGLHMLGGRQYPQLQIITIEQALGALNHHAASCHWGRVKASGGTGNRSNARP